VSKDGREHLAQNTARGAIREIQEVFEHADLTWREAAGLLLVAVHEELALDVKHHGPTSPPLTHKVSL
jgi:hypothetical protein